MVALVMRDTHTNGRGHSVPDYRMQFFIQIMTKGNSQWKTVSDGINSLNVAIVCADSKLSRKFPQRIAVRVIDETKRARFERIKHGYEATMKSREIVQSYVERFNN